MESKKKIIWIVNNFSIGGSERVVVDIISQLKLQCDIDVITVLGGGVMQGEFEDHSSRIYFAGPQYVNNTTFLGKMIWIIYSPIVFLKLFLYLKKEKPHAVLSSLFLADILGMSMSRLLGVKTRILVQHDVYKFGWFKNFLKTYFGFKNATKIVAVSEAVGEFLNDSKEKVVVIPNGVDVKKMKLGIREANKELVFGYIGRLEPIKGPGRLIDAIDLLETNPEFRITGDGSLRSSLDKKVSNIIFLGPTNNVPDALSKIDVLIVPSEEEGFGLVVIEALFAEKVVIASNIPAIRELVVHENNGLLFNATEELSKAIDEIYSDRALFGKLRSNVAKWGKKNEKKFDISEKSTEYLRVLDL